jgi:hypothetical protein
MRSPREMLRGLLSSSPRKRGRGADENKEQEGDDSLPTAATTSATATLAATLGSLGDRMGLTLADVTGTDMEGKESRGAAPSGAGETVTGPMGGMEQEEEEEEEVEEEAPPPLRMTMTMSMSFRCVGRDTWGGLWYIWLQTNGDAHCLLRLIHTCIPKAAGGGPRVGALPAL